MEIVALSPIALGPTALAPSGLTVDYFPGGEADAGVSARLNRTLDDVTCASTGVVVAHVVGSLSSTLDSVTISSTGDVQTPAGESVRFTMVAADWDVSVTAFRAGESGSNYFGAFIAIPSVAHGDHAWYFTHDGRGWDPQPYNAALTGYTMHQIDLAAGDRTDAQVATAVRSAIDGAAIYDTVGGSGANVDITSDIDAGGCFTGEDTPGASGCWGSREDTPAATSTVVNAIHAATTFTAGPALISALGTRLTDAGDPFRMALHTGGSLATGGGGTTVTEADLEDTVLFCETGQVTGSGTGWVVEPLVPAQIDVMADNTVVQYGFKGETTTTLGNFMSTGAPGDTDQNVQNLQSFVTGDLDPDPSVAYPATLEGVGLDSSFAVMLMIAFEYRVAPQRGDAGGITVTEL